jgi:hypothetical protein
MNPSIFQNLSIADGTFKPIILIDNSPSTI